MELKSAWQRRKAIFHTIRWSKTDLLLWHNSSVLPKLHLSSSKDGYQIMNGVTKPFCANRGKEWYCFATCFAEKLQILERRPTSLLAQLILTGILYLFIYLLIRNTLKAFFLTHISRITSWFATNEFGTVRTLTKHVALPRSTMVLASRKWRVQNGVHWKEQTILIVTRVWITLSYVSSHWLYTFMGRGPRTLKNRQVSEQSLKLLKVQWILFLDFLLFILIWPDASHLRCPPH